MRTSLRWPRISDAAVHTYASDPEVVRYMDWGPNSSAGMEAFVAAAVNPMDGVHPFAVERSGTLIGAVELRVTAAAHRRGEFGCVLAESAGEARDVADRSAQRCLGRRSSGRGWGQGRPAATATPTRA